MTAPDPSPFRVTSHNAGTAVVVEVAGEVDLSTADDVAAAVTAGLASRPSAVVLDLTGVSFLDSAGLAVLARGHLAAVDGVEFRVVAGNEAVLKPIQLTGMDQMLAMFGSVAEATDSA
ncbi:MAG TPA: STAS domain-containing protein [Pseudonocardiaceae bacterium]|jgi:anti-anti-sigma factor|nr:STAS domain-containing protein [Pseudonocardiaceae bacterium]